MNRSRSHPWLSGAMLAFLMVHQIARAESSSAISPAITVDTRDLVEIKKIRTKLKSQQSETGQQLVLQRSNTIGLNRNSAQPAYLELTIPEFSAKGKGWDKEMSGMGTFHGLELIYKGNSKDRIYQKIGGSPPSSSTPESEWQKVSSNRILPSVLKNETRYYKVVFSGNSPGKAKLEVRFHSARLAQSNGKPVTSLDANNDLWIVIHDSDGGVDTLQPLHKALEKARRKDQVVTLDWASASTSDPFWSKPATSAEYFQNLGQNLAQTIKQNGFKPAQVHFIGHGWGAVIAYETAKKLKGSGRIIALDPTAGGAGAYNNGSVKFSRSSKTSTTIKSGSRGQGSLGDENMSTSSDYAIRLLSKSHSGSRQTNTFHHALPVDWLIQCLASKEEPYWPFLRKSIVLRTKPTPTLPWEASGTVTGGFDLECHGKTTHSKNASLPSDQASMDKVTHFSLERKKQNTEARATHQNGKTTWKYRVAK